jgi:hypothetical protein
VRALVASLGCLAACTTPGGAGPGPASWSTSSVDYGPGQIIFGLRYRWVAERDTAGAVVRTPEGGEAWVRVFSCGRPWPVVESAIRARLRSRLVANELVSEEGQRIYSLRYFKGQTATGVIVSAAVVVHGPLLVSVTSSTIVPSDLVGIAHRLRLALPVATIPGCVPLCDIEDARCVPQGSDEETAERDGGAGK